MKIASSVKQSAASESWLQWTDDESVYGDAKAIHICNKNETEQKFNTLYRVSRHIVLRGNLSKTEILFLNKNNMIDATYYHIYHQNSRCRVSK